MSLFAQKKLLAISMLKSSTVSCFSKVTADAQPCAIPKPPEGMYPEDILTLDF